MPTPEVKVGQVWERIKDGVRVEIIEVDEWWRDITYRRVDRKAKGQPIVGEWEAVE